jgi:RNase H-like domain found in reverse transcriptase/Reverse transcriptase (RNA-dependent DNA polymerase)/Integrase zinc binding domain/Chromo (CHRromatin Organisation MOdifier) domain/Aspartyl protease
MAANAAAAAAAAAVVAARPPTVTRMPKWNRTETQRLVDHLTNHRFHCHYCNVPDAFKAGVLYDSLPESFRATIRNNCIKHAVDLLEATVDQMKEWLQIMPDAADKSQNALRLQLETMRINYAKFSTFLDEWNALLDRCMEYEPPMDAATQCYLFYRCLCTRIRSLVATDSSNRQWTDVVKLQSAASTFVESILGEEGPGAFSRDVKAVRGNAERPEQRQEGAKRQRGQRGQRGRGGQRSEQRERSHTGSKGSVVTWADQANGGAKKNRGGKKGGKGGRSGKPAKFPCRTCAGMELGDLYHYPSECPNIKGTYTFSPGFLTEATPALFTPAAASLPASITAPNASGDAVLASVLATSDMHASAASSDIPVIAAAASLDTAMHESEHTPASSISHVYQRTLGGVEVYTFDPAEYIHEPDGDDPALDELLYLQHYNRDTLPVTHPLLWASILTVIQQQLPSTTAPASHLPDAPDVEPLDKRHPVLAALRSYDDSMKGVSLELLPVPGHARSTPPTLGALPGRESLHHAGVAAVQASATAGEGHERLLSSAPPPRAPSAQDVDALLEECQGMLDVGAALEAAIPSGQQDARASDVNTALHGGGDDVQQSGDAAHMCSTSNSGAGKGNANVHLALQPDSLNWLENSFGLRCSLEVSNSIGCARSATCIASSVTPFEFTRMELRDQVVYMQPSEFDLQPHLQHYLNQKQQHPQLGALLVVPAMLTVKVPSELQHFQHVHTYKSGEYVFETPLGAKARTKQPYYVYMSRPASQSGVTVVAPDQMSTELLFNLPCTIAGGKSTVHIDSKSLIDTGCGTSSLLSKRAASRLALKLQPCTQTFALADGSLTECLGRATLRVKIQGHTFTVMALVVDMNDSFDLVLGQQWLVDHRAVIDFDRQTIALKKGTVSCTLRTPRQKASYARSDSDPTTPKPIAATAVARHARKGGKVYEFRVYSADPSVASPVPAAAVSKAADKPDGTAAPPSEHQARIDQIKREFADRFVTELPPDQAGPQAPEMAQTEPDSRPPFTPAYRASPRELAEMRKQTFEGIAAGRIRVSDSPYGSGVLFVVKSDGSLRMCVDYRRLNKQTIKQRHPIPRIDHLLDQFGNAKVFSLLDLKAGYAQIRLHPKDIPRSAFTTPFGHFEYTVVPFGMANAPSAFSKIMQHVLRSVLGRCAEVYLDDVMVFSSTPEQHQKDLATVLQLLRDHNLYANAKKCTLFTHEVKYLGHIINKDGISVDPGKTAKLRDWPVPTSVKELQAFLGLCNYFRRFIRSYSEVARPLTALTSKNAWHPLTSVELSAFQQLKDTLVSPPVLAIPQFDKPFDVFTDASDNACGAILIQENRPVAFFSKKFTPAERNYPTHDRECLGIVAAYREWRCYLEGVPSTCHTDHAPLTQLQSQPQISRRQARWLEFLASFQPNVVYVQGKANPADVLSRPPHELLAALSDARTTGRRHAPVLPNGLGGEASALGYNTPLAQEGRSFVLVHSRQAASSPADLYQGGVSALVARDTRCLAHKNTEYPGNELETDTSCQTAKLDAGLHKILLCAVNPVTHRPVIPMLTGDEAQEWWLSAYKSDKELQDPHFVEKYQLTQRNDFWYFNDKLIVVPSLLRSQVLGQCHDALTSAHFGVTKTLNQIQRHFWWPGYRRDTHAYIKKCLSCARNKPAMQKPYGMLSPLPVPEKPWDSVSMDFITDLPKTTNKNDAILVVVDRLTKMTHFIPCAISCTAQQACDLFIQNVIRLHGCPSSIVVDRDPRWRSSFWQSWCQLVTIHVGMSTAFHPQTDGQTERMNRTLEEVLRHYINPSHTSWETLLPWAEFAVNSAFQESIKTTPFLLNYGWQPTTPFELGLRAIKAAAPTPPHPDAAALAASAAQRIAEARRCLQAAQDRQKRYADTKRAPLTLSVGQSVLLSSKNIKIATTGTPKLLPRYLGPFKVVRLIGTAAVKLEIPATWKLHPVFHVSLLKLWDGPTSSEPLAVEVDGLPEYTIETVLSHRLQSRGRGRPVTMYLIKWEGFGDEANSWEPEKNLTGDGVYTNTKLTEYWSSIPRLPTASSQPPAGRNLSTAKVQLKRTKRPAPKPAKSRSRQSKK